MAKNASTTTTKKKNAKAPTTPLTLTDAIIRPVQSKYSEKTTSRIDAKLIFDGGTAQAAIAFAFRCAATLMSLLDGVGGKFTMPQIDNGWDGKRHTATIRYELCDGTPEEADAIANLMHDAIPAPQA